ncbi:MAG: 3-isopropylmalate dehydrogenase, partial [Clostridiales bacterium]|nr:3-isopropylmalate dehydrogenase [Clostridiales bacterium]
PLKPSLTKKGVNLVFVRDQTGGIYYGQRGYRDGKNGQEAFDTEVYAIAEVERIADLAFTVAMGRRKKVTSIDKADILESGRLWRATVTKIAQNYPEVQLNHMPVSSCAAQLAKDPSQFDVILCPAMFGDILSAIAGTLTGSHALIPSSSLGATKLGLYEPIHSAAHDIAGKDTANPLGAILAAAMMLSSSFNLPQETAAVEKAINTVLSKGYRTADLAESGNKIVSCSKMGELIATEILNG